ncbi:Putative sensor-like histidine kinase YfhK [hydrothermal vent metagenome]|uniref:histidine kinase n=1 Tax=hydrothermal vent metagenome TaxID=652676 RepID=A0A3B1AE90_9ZZZZ
MNHAMRLTLPTSIFQLALIGFFLAALPLAAALVNTFMLIDKLSVQMQLAVRDSSRAVEASRIIMTQVLNMERSTGQYLVLRDPAVLQRYEDQRSQLAKAMTHLEDLTLTESLAQRLSQLRQQEKALYHQLHEVAEMPEKLPAGLPQRLTEKHDLTRLARPIPFEVTQMIAEESNVMTRQVESVQRQLLWQALGLIPLALILAVIFSVLISRPLRRLGTVIRRLGAGELTTAVTVGGPQDIRELSEQLDWLRQRLSELDEQKQAFLHHVSHELKTPLTAIREGVELLREEVVGTLNNEQAEVADILRESSLQLQTQVEALLNFNAALAQRSLLRQETVELHTLLPEIIDKHRLALQARKISVHRELQAVSLCGEREQLRTLLDNLLSNAIKYSPDGGQIRISLRSANDHAQIDVIDDGPGIPSTERQQIFEPFFQGRQSPRSHVKGTGLGLAIAQRYARLHRGNITVQDNGAGAHLRVTLPLDGEHNENNE